MPVTIGPCDWDIPDPTCCALWDNLDQDAKDRAKRGAAWLLWFATGRQFGRCTTTLRPCRRSCEEPNGGWPPRPDGRLVGYGRWVAVFENPAAAAWAGGLCQCGHHTCSCGKLCEVHLPGTLPEPTQVLVDGVEVPLSRFRVDNGHWLVWTGAPVDTPRGEVACFPTCQDLALPATETGTWEITYTHGLPVPVVGLDVAAELACELAMACDESTAGECRLPANVTAITRAGVTMEFASASTTNDTSRIARFNIPAVDLWVESINPYGNTDNYRAWSPDLPRPGRVTTWP